LCPRRPPPPRNSPSTSIFLGNQAVRWAAGGTTATPLGDLGSDGGGYGNSRIFAVSGDGVAAGNGQKGDLGTRALRWAAGQTVPTELGVLGFDANGRSRATAYGVNAAGDTVGTASKYVNGSEIEEIVTFWRGGQTAAVELNTLLIGASGWSVSWASDINDAGQIAGQGLFGGREYAVLLEPARSGDANGDRTVSFADLVVVAQHYNTGGASWATGDFDGNGSVGFTDLVLLAQNYAPAGASSPSFSPAFEADWRLASVPEPSAPLAALFPTVLLLRRRSHDPRARRRVAP
jgi:hypothetical protein